MLQNRPWEYYGKEDNTKYNILQNPILYDMSRTVKSIKTESRLVVGRGCGEGDWEW